MPSTKRVMTPLLCLVIAHPKKTQSQSVDLITVAKVQLFFESTKFAKQILYFCIKIRIIRTLRTIRTIKTLRSLRSLRTITSLTLYGLVDF